MKRNKIILGIGSMTAIIAPVVAVVSCGESTETKRDKASVKFIKDQILNKAGTMYINNHNEGSQYTVLDLSGSNNLNQIKDSIAKNYNLTLEQETSIELVTKTGKITYGVHNGS